MTLREAGPAPRQADGTAQGQRGMAVPALLDRQVQAARLAESSASGRVAALERYAAEVREADAADRNWQQALAELSGRHLDMLARTAADEHGVADIQAMSQHARAVGLALRELPR